ncbi:hypothetical protein [Pseudomonas subflava]|uniref:hypothetical protein n=1 Tax=Pseudomonas subflava TaxID=2952933 RepID=UPI00207A9593|nr:hypothetical protein [Pseudomonas subflava]
MQTTTFTQQQADDYLTSMQAAATGFIERHEAEHLHDDQLFGRTVQYLVGAMGVPVFMADRITHLAMSDRLPKGRPLASVDLATGAVLDNRTRCWLQPPLRTLPDRFLAASATR